MPFADPSVRADPRMLTTPSEMIEDRGNVDNWHDIADSPPEPVGDSRIVQPASRVSNELSEDGLDPLRVGPSHIEG